MAAPPYTPAKRTYRAEVLAACFESKKIAEAKVRKIERYPTENVKDNWMTHEPLTWWSAYVTVLDELIAYLVTMDVRNEKPATGMRFGFKEIRAWVEMHARRLTGITEPGHVATANALVSAAELIRTGGSTLEAAPACGNVIEFPRAYGRR